MEDRQKIREKKGKMLMFGHRCCTGSIVFCIVLQQWIVLQFSLEIKVPWGVEENVV